MSTKYVFDSSALLAVLFSEKGADEVPQFMQGGHYISTVNMCEVLSKLQLKGVEIEPFDDAVEVFGLTLIPFSYAISIKAARLITLTEPYGLSLGDRACLATAMHMKAVAVTADKVWKKLDSKPFPEIRLIR